jgi:hypothetical protein
MFSERTMAHATFAILLLALSTSASWAGTLQGSTTTSRPILDSAIGQVYIYDGGFFPNNETVSTFSWLGNSFSGSRFMTPLLFEETAPGVFVVRDIGAGQTVTSSGSPQSFSFNVQQGTGTTNSSLFVFGFINGLVDSNGHQTSSSAGTVTLDMVTDPGNGVGGPPTTNDWVFTPTESNVSVGLGTTFGTPGNTGTSFALNNPALGTFDTDRTYSANLNGSTPEGPTVPEPGTFGLFTSGAGLLLAGLIRRQRAQR